MKINTLDDGIGFVQLVDRMQVDHALKVANSARISYDRQTETFEQKEQALCHFLWKHGHTSPFRHSFYTFHLKAPMFVFRQAFKYQVGSGWREYEVDGVSVSLDVFDVMFDTDKGCSWNEISGRYVEMNPEFYVPQKMRANPPHGNKQATKELPEDFNHEGYRHVMSVAASNAYSIYESMIKEGVSKEIARMILPQNIYSQAYWTVSLQGVIHFLEQRLKPDAQYEVRMYAKAIYELIKDDLTKIGIKLENT